MQHMFAKSKFISFICVSNLLCSFWFQVYSEILLAWTWKPHLPSVQHREPWNPTWSPYYGGKTVHPLSKCVLWWHCHISLCSHICQNSDILKVCDQSVLSSFEHRQRWNFDPCQTDKPCRRRREFAPPLLLFSLYNPLCPRHPMSI